MRREESNILRSRSVKTEIKFNKALNIKVCKMRRDLID